MSGPFATAREHARLAHERIRLLAGQPLGFRVRGSLTFDREQFARIAHVVGAEDHGVEERKYNGHQPKADRHRRHDCQGRQRRAAERADRVSDIPDHALEPHLQIHRAFSMTASLPRKFDCFGVIPSRNNRAAGRRGSNLRV